MLDEERRSAVSAWEELRREGGCEGDGDLIPDVGVGDFPVTDEAETELRFVITGFLSFVRNWTSAPLNLPTTPSQCP